MKYVMLETSGVHGLYRVVHNHDYVAEGPVFAFEYRTLDALDNESWRPVDVENVQQLRHLLDAVCYELAHTKLAQEEAKPDGDVIVLDEEGKEEERR